MVQLFARTLVGNTVTVDLEPTDTASAAACKIAQKQGLPCAEGLGLRLVHEGRQLDADAALDERCVAGATLHLLPRMRAGVIEPSLVVLAKKFNVDKKVCRLCYARLPPRAVNCRKKACGHTNQLRLKKKLK